jgi:hypothetical protein
MSGISLLFRKQISIIEISIVEIFFCFYEFTKILKFKNENKTFNILFLSNNFFTAWV